jgi:hypothetical protein
MAAGNAGGTQITIKFKKRSIKVVDSIPIAMKLLKSRTKPSTAMQAISKTNFMASA